MALFRDGSCMPCRFARLLIYATLRFFFCSRAARANLDFSSCRGGSPFLRCMSLVPAACTSYTSCCWSRKSVTMLVEGVDMTAVSLSTTSIDSGGSCVFSNSVHVPHKASTSSCQVPPY
ncbi:hypothetical protein V8C86DRAFT_2449848 [Haematococcus lacustris]